MFRKRASAKAALLAALALSGITSSAYAAIVCGPTANLPIPDNLDGVYLNLVTGANGTSGAGTAGWDFNGYETGTPLALFFFWPTTPADSFGGVATGSVYDVLAAAAPIGPGQNYSLASGGGGNANFVNWHAANGNNFLGLRFFNEATASINYGWMRLNTTSPAGFPATIVQYCYQNDGTQIVAGDTGGGGANTAPTLTYTPTTAAGVTLQGGVAGSVNTTIAISSAGAAGTGQSAVTGCAITGPGAGSFGAVTTTPANGIFNTGTTTGSINLSCTRGAAAASASLACTETATPAVAGSPFTRTWALTCPAATVVVPASITLAATVGTTPGVCAATDAVTVAAGSQVHYCYTVTNTGGQTVGSHDLSDTVNGPVLNDLLFSLAPGASTSVVVPSTATATGTNTGTWTGVAGIDPAATFNYIPINVVGTALNLTDDSEANIVSPFPITYFGVTSTNLRVGNNGGILFDAVAGDVGFTNAALPTATNPLAIYPHWDDVDDESGNVYWHVQGAAPNRQLIVEWFDRPLFPGPGVSTVTFQVVFSEGSSQIRFQYLDVDAGSAALNNGASATVGLNASATVAQQASFNRPVLANNQAILFTPPGALVSSTVTATDSTTVTVLFPDINVSPLALNSTQLAGSSVTLPLNIGNVGQAPLNWTIAETFPDRPGPSNRRAAREPVFNVPAAVTSAKDCAAFANYPFSEPAGWAEFCAAASSSPSSAGSPSAPTSTGFTLNLRTPDRNLKRFILNDFPGQTVVGAQAANIYGLDFDATATTLHALNVSTNELGTLNTTTGAFTSTVACVAPEAGTWTGLSIDPVSNVFYASTAANLYTLSPTTCAPILVGPFGITSGIMIDIAVNAAGAMYGHDIFSDSIYTINKTTGAATLVGPTGIAANFAQGMDFDNETGTLYIFAYIGTGANRYGTVNLTTGAVTVLATDNPLGEFEGATQTLGVCQPNDYPWLSVSPAAGTTAAGASTVANVTFNATGQVCGATYTAQLCVRSNDPTGGSGNGTSLVRVPVSMTVNCAADLAVTLTDSPDPVIAGNNLSYLATLTNLGPSDAQDATITLPLAAGTSLVSATPSPGGVCNAASPVVCTWAGVTAPAGVRSVTIVTAVAASQTTNLSATATASSLTTDPNPVNNSDTATTTVNTSADLLMSLSSSVTQVLVNVSVTFTAISLNQGPSDAQNQSVTMTLTPDFRYSGHTATGATCTTPQVGNSGAIVCTWAGATAPGVSRTLVVTAFSNVEGLTGVSASTTSNTTDPVANNNVGNVSVQVGYLVEEIPALNGLGLILLGLMLGLVGFVAVRRQA